MSSVKVSNFIDEFNTTVTYTCTAFPAHFLLALVILYEEVLIVLLPRSVSVSSSNGFVFALIEFYAASEYGHFLFAFYIRSKRIARLITSFNGVFLNCPRSARKPVLVLFGL